VRKVRLERDLLTKNALLAASNRRAFAARKIAVFNLIGSPGAGKTALLEATIRRLRTELSLAVLEGDQATNLDARRIERAGSRVIQINTDTKCHLDATTVSHGVDALAPAAPNVVFVENVGNLVCPALFDLGEHAKVVVMSVTEGDDKPAKYPHVFRAAKALVLTKTDLIEHVPFDERRCLAYAREINPRILSFRLSALTGQGLAAWCRWVRDEVKLAWASQAKAS
jgi:hydrogenase nickel incorporation protein HypB